MIDRDVYTVDFKDGWLCIKHECSHFIDPVIVANYWPSERANRSDWEYLIGATASGSSGEYYARTPNQPGSRWHKITLWHGANTQPIATVVTPIPCPKVRKGIETRYRSGQWEKYLKTGWTSA